ncbi:MAG: glutaryl-7-ACA acylase, partial [Burkholderiales bacterium]
MRLFRCFCTLVLLAPLPTFAQAPPKYPALPSETPASFKPTFAGFDYERRDVMIAMRDGVKLHTVILVPKGRK